MPKNRACNAAHDAGVINKLEESSCKIDNLGYLPLEISKAHGRSLESYPRGSKALK